MEENDGAHILEQREILVSLDREFARLHFRSIAIIETTPAPLLYDVAVQPGLWPN